MQDLIPSEPLLTEAETAAFLGVKPETLATWRSTRRYALAYVRVGRAIRYRRCDIENFLRRRTVDASDSELDSATIKKSQNHF